MQTGFQRGISTRSISLCTSQTHRKFQALPHSSSTGLLRRYQRHFAAMQTMRILRGKVLTWPPLFPFYSLWLFVFSLNDDLACLNSEPIWLSFICYVTLQTTTKHRWIDGDAKMADAKSCYQPKAGFRYARQCCVFPALPSPVTLQSGYSARGTETLGVCCSGHTFFIIAFQPLLRIDNPPATMTGHKSQAQVERLSVLLAWIRQACLPFKAGARYWNAIGLSTALCIVDQHCEETLEKNSYW
jgi:hypothetical protein